VRSKDTSRSRGAILTSSAKFSAENARYDGVLFGSVRGATEMHDGAFVFRPLRAYDGGASISIEGTTRYRKDPKRPTLDLVLTAKDYPVKRFLEYLDLDYPIEGRLTGSFPLTGSPPDTVSGGGVAALDDAVLWGQRVPRLTGRMGLTPGHFELDDIRAEIGGGMFGGRIAIAYKEKTFEARGAGDGLPLEALDSLAAATRDVTGRVSFELAGSGTFSRPDLKVSATMSEATFFGHAIPETMTPRLALTVTQGQVDGTVSVPERWTLTARGDAGATPIALDVALDAPDLAALMLFTPAALPVADGGALAAHGRVQLPQAAGESPSGQFVVTAARLDLGDRKGLVRTDGDVTIEVSKGRIALGELHAVGDGVDLRLRGAVDLSGEKAALEGRATGSADASVLALAYPDLGLGGRLVVDFGVSGPAAAPAFKGGIRIEGGRYRMAGYSFEEIEGSLRLAGSTGELEGLRAKVAEGEAFVAGSFRLAGTEVRDFPFQPAGPPVLRARDPRRCG